MLRRPGHLPAHSGPLTIVQEFRVGSKETHRTTRYIHNSVPGLSRHSLGIVFMSCPSSAPEMGRLKHINNVVTTAQSQDNQPKVFMFIAFSSLPESWSMAGEDGLFSTAAPMLPCLLMGGTYRTWHVLQESRLLYVRSSDTSDVRCNCNLRAISKSQEGGLKLSAGLHANRCSWTATPISSACGSENTSPTRSAFGLRALQ